MKTYIKPSVIITGIKLDKHLLIISGGENALHGGSNGEYTNGVTLGSRSFSVWDDDDEDEE